MRGHELLARRRPCQLVDRETRENGKIQRLLIVPTSRPESVGVSTFSTEVSNLAPRTGAAP